MATTLPHVDIAANKIENALNLLRGRYEERSEVIVLMSRFNRLEEQRVHDVQLKEEARTERNQLEADVLKLLGRLEKQE